MSSVLERLSEGVQWTDRTKEIVPLINKWKTTGLLEGLNEAGKANMAVLLENEVKALISEATTMGGGNIEGFSQVAFPLVRRVFGKMVANKVVSVQPTSLPTALIAFIDFTYNTSRLNETAGTSVYGGGRVGRDISSGTFYNDTGSIRYGELGFFGMNNGYSSATGTLSVSAANTNEHVAPFMVGNDESTDKWIRFDPDLQSGSYATIVKATLTQAQLDVIPARDLVAIKATLSTYDSGSTQVRRLTTISGTTLMFVFHATASMASLVDATTALTLVYPRTDSWAASLLGGIVGTSAWELENQPEIPEINIFINQIPITTQSKKLKAKWSPEGSQDMKAYHNTDPEAELTTILGDLIEMEIDNQILEDLVKGANAGTYYWSRFPGKFVDRVTGADVSNTTSAPDFTGNVSMWYETLLEVVNDLSAQIYRKVRKGGANFIVTSPEIASILEMTNGFKASVEVDAESGDAGVTKVGTVSRKWDIYISPNFYNNVMLVGRKGAGFLESGYVYAPYVPAVATPTLLGPEDFMPRMGIMTRYATKMVLSDYYGLILIQNLRMNI